MTGSVASRLGAEFNQSPKHEKSDLANQNPHRAPPPGKPGAHRPNGIEKAGCSTNRRKGHFKPAAIISGFRRDGTCSGGILFECTKSNPPSGRICVSRSYHPQSPTLVKTPAPTDGVELEDRQTCPESRLTKRSRGIMRLAERRRSRRESKKPDKEFVSAVKGVPVRRPCAHTARLRC